MSETTTKKLGWVIDIHKEVGPFDVQYRAELWWRPYSGRMVASTPWVSSKRIAQAAGNRFFGPFVKAQP